MAIIVGMAGAVFWVLTYLLSKRNLPLLSRVADIVVAPLLHVRSVRPDIGLLLAVMFSRECVLVLVAPWIDGQFISSPVPTFRDRIPFRFFDSTP